MTRREWRLVLITISVIAALGAALSWTRMTFNARVEHALATIADDSRGVFTISRKVMSGSLLGQTERLDIVINTGKPLRLTAISRVLILPGAITGDLHLKVPSSGVEFAGLDVAELKVELGRDAGRWWFSPLSGKLDVTYHSPKIALTGVGSAGAPAFVLTIEPTELVANFYGFDRGFNYRGVWRGMRGGLPGGVGINVRMSNYKGAGRFDSRPQYRWDYGFIKQIEITGPRGSLSIAELRLRSRQRVEKDYLDMRGIFSSGVISARFPGESFDVDSTKLDYRIRDLHADSYEELLQLGRESSVSGGVVEASLLKLLSRGVRVSLDQLRLLRGADESTVTGRVDIARSGVAYVGVDAVLRHTDADLAIDLSDALIAASKSATALADRLVAQGVLQRDGHGRLRLQASVADGMVTVNGNTRPR